MSLMIPDVYDIEKSSDAEVKIFHWFERDPRTSDWIVLHSLALDKHSTLIQGEIDFLVIAPNLGVFAMEVKGGRVEREAGKWKYTDRNNNVSYKARGPFEQASDGIFSIFNLIKQKFGNDSKLSKLLFGHAAMFPDIEFDYESPEFHKTQVFDIRNGSNVYDFIKNLSGYCKYKFQEKHGSFSIDKMPTKNDTKTISDFLRPNFEVKIPLLHLLNGADDKITRLTEEQYNAIDSISDNKRILVLGSAGTGKTVIALQTLKKMVISGNDNVALFCYNSNLGEWLGEYAGNNFKSENYFVGSFHSFLIQIVKRVIPDKISRINDFDDDFFSSELPLLALEALEKCPKTFDYIIVDEFQDLFNENYLLVFDEILKNGFERGRWIFFADFANQNIFSEGTLNESQCIDHLENITSFSISRLKINCRNTIKIVNEIEIVMNIKYKSISNQVDGVPVHHHIYSSFENEILELNKLVLSIKKEKIQPKDIIFLSPKKFSESAASRIDEKMVLFNPCSNEAKSFAFSTIQGFKGLERKIVVILDVDNYEQIKLLYVGFSRARTMLHVFETKEASDQRYEKLAERI